MSGALHFEPEVVVPPGEDELPYSFGPPMDSDVHRDNMYSLIYSLREHLAEVPDVYVSGDMAMYFSALQVKKNDFLGPDVFVVLDTSKRRRKSWVVWEEERTPSIVIEITSPTTELKDRGEKMRIYARALNVPEYFIYDPATGTLDGWRRDASGHYEPLEPVGDAEYRSSALPVGLKVVGQTYLGEEVRWLRWTDPHGALIPLAAERADQAERRADEQQQRADEQQHRADEQQHRADEQQHRADEQQHRAEALAAKLRALGIDPEGA